MLARPEHHARAKGEGRRIRRARNLIRRYRENPEPRLRERFLRAQALLVHTALVDSK